MSIVLELLGLLLVAAFAWFVWQPLPLLVVGVAFLAASYVRERRGGDRQ